MADAVGEETLTASDLIALAAVLAATLTWALAEDGASLQQEEVTEVSVIARIHGTTDLVTPPPTPVPTPTPEPTPMPVEPIPPPIVLPAVELPWGDVDCDESVSIGDALKIARYLLGLSVSQEEGCPEIGAEVSVDQTSRLWGDVDCDGEVAIGDALKVARYLIGLPISQGQGCPEVGVGVQVSH